MSSLEPDRTEGLQLAEPSRSPTRPPRTSTTRTMAKIGQPAESATQKEPQEKCQPPYQHRRELRARDMLDRLPGDREKRPRLIANLDTQAHVSSGWR